MRVNSDVTSTQGTVAHPSARFQVEGCKRLKFKPKLSLKLKGGTKRARLPGPDRGPEGTQGRCQHRPHLGRPAPLGVPRPGTHRHDLHPQTVCRRKMPQGLGLRQGQGLDPLLAKPLSGPGLPEELQPPPARPGGGPGGRTRVNLVGRIDSHNGGIRTTFESVPDAPVTKFVLKMKGGAKGLLINSTDICRGSHRAMVAMWAQNGRAVNQEPKLVAGGCKAKK